MNRQEILKFIAENKNELLLDFYNKTYEKLRDLNRKIDKLTLYLIVLVFIYFITSKSSIASFQIGPFNISDISIIIQVIPPLFSFLLFDLIITSNHRSEVYTVVKLIYLANYKQEIKPEQLDNTNNGFLTRVILPFSYSNELLKFISQKKKILNSLLGLLLIVPLSIIIIGLPIYLEFYMLRNLYLNYMEFSLGKISFYSSIWIIAYFIYQLTNSMINGYRNYKLEMN